MITTKHLKILNRLVGFALQNNPTRRKHFSAIKCGKSIFFGMNSYVNGSSASKDGYKYPYPHAEYAIASKIDDINELYVVRINKKNQLINSSPCLECRRFLKSKGVRIIIYSMEDGFRMEKI